MNHENLDNQLENLFSDIDVPEPLISQEATSETARADILNSFQAVEHIARLTRRKVPAGRAVVLLAYLLSRDPQDCARRMVPPPGYEH